MKPITQFIIIFGLIAGVVLIGDIFDGSPFYIVDETEQVVITRFGAPIDTKQEPGLQTKIPFVHRANYFPKNILEWDGDPSQIPTQEKKNIYVDIFARWKIVDALTYFKKVTNEKRAQAQLDSVLNAAVRNLIQSKPLIESVRNTNRIMETDILTRPTEEETTEDTYTEVKLGRDKLTRLIMEQAEAKVRELGIELVDVQFKRLNYTPSVREAVFKRMIEERKQIAAKYRSEGQGESQKWRGRTAKELKAIEAEAYRKSQEIKGKADAEAAQIYAEAYGKDLEFYALVKTLELYKKLPEKEIELLLSTDSDFFKYLKGIGQ